MILQTMFLRDCDRRTCRQHQPTRRSRPARARRQIRPGSVMVTRSTRHPLPHARGSREELEGIARPRRRFGIPLLGRLNQTPRTNCRSSSPAPKTMADRSARPPTAPRARFAGMPAAWPRAMGALHADELAARCG